MEPHGLTWMLERVAREYPGTPMMICENGAAFVDEVGVDGSVADSRWTEYLKTHIDAVRVAMAGGVDVRGYFVWSLLDNFEWARGYEKWFGIVRVDYETMRRTVKASGLWYRDFLAGRASTD